jgi:hypothetical protein
MVFRRHKALWIILAIVVGGTLKFSYNYYTENELKLNAANIRHHELLEDRNKMSRELEGKLFSKSSCQSIQRSIYVNTFINCGEWHVLFAILSKVSTTYRITQMKVFQWKNY